MKKEVKEMLDEVFHKHYKGDPLPKLYWNLDYLLKYRKNIATKTIEDGDVVFLRYGEYYYCVVVLEGVIPDKGRNRGDTAGLAVVGIYNGIFEKPEIDLKLLKSGKNIFYPLIVSGISKYGVWGEGYAYRYGNVKEYTKKYSPYAFKNWFYGYVTSTEEVIPPIKRMFIRHVSVYGIGGDSLLCAYFEKIRYIHTHTFTTAACISELTIQRLPQKKEVSPFVIDGDRGEYFLSFSPDSYRKEIFDQYGKEANGYNWEALAKQYVERNLPQLKEHFFYDSEAGMMVILSPYKKHLQQFLKGFEGYTRSSVFENDVKEMEEE